jgi:hypothetical protein
MLWVATFHGLTKGPPQPLSDLTLS